MLNNDKKLGILRHLDYAYQEELVQNIDLCMEDLLNGPDSIRANIRELERVLKHMLYGTDYDGGDDRPLPEKLTM